jgi:general secretion pathway protein D
MKKIVPLVALVAWAWGCATVSPVYRKGTAAEMNQQYDEAVKYYERAALENPKESAYRLALLRAKAAAALHHVALARRYASFGNTEAAGSEYRLALGFDPLNRGILRELQTLEAPAPAQKPSAPSAEDAPVKLKGAGEKLTLSFPSEISLKSIFRTLGKMAGVNFLYDEQFRDVPLSADLTGRDLEQAVAFLCLAGKCFYRVIDERTVIIVPDLPMKRMQYEINGIKTFYLSNLVAKDIQGPLTQLTRGQMNQVQPNIQIDNILNAVTIRGNPQTLALAEKLIQRWDKAVGEVVIAIEIMEVSRVRLQQLGIDLSQEGVAIRLNPDGMTSDGWIRLNSLGLGNAGNYEISLPSAILQFISGDSDTKLIAQPRIRGVAGTDISYLVGQKVPVPQATFNPIAAGGLATQPVVQYTLQDVGIDIKVKPRIHFENEVTLEVEIKISSITGSGIADIPIIGTREIKNTIRLKDGETNLLAGLLKDEERTSVRGIVGLKDIPLLGRLFSSTQVQIEQTDVIMTLTPYIIRNIDLAEEDLRTLWVETDGLSGISSGGAESALQERILAQEEMRAAEQAPEPEEAGGVNAVFLTPASFEVPRQREFRVNLALRNETDVASLSLNVDYDPQVVQLKEVVQGGIVRQLGDKVPFLTNIDNSSGNCTIGFSSPSLGKGLKGGGVLAVLVFTAVSPGDTMIIVANCVGSGPQGQSVPFDTGDARILVR